MFNTAFPTPMGSKDGSRGDTKAQSKLNNKLSYSPGRHWRTRASRTAAVGDVEHDAKHVDFIKSLLFAHRPDHFLLHSRLIQISCLNPLTNSMLLEFGITLCLRTVLHALRTALKCSKRYSDERKSIAFFCYHHTRAFVLCDHLGRNFAYLDPGFAGCKGCGQTPWTTQYVPYSPVRILPPPFDCNGTNMFQPYGVVQNLLHYQVSLI